MAGTHTSSLPEVQPGRAPVTGSSTCASVLLIMFKNTIGSRIEGHGFALLRKKKTENAYRKLKAKEALVARKQGRQAAEEKEPLPRDEPSDDVTKPGAAFRKKAAVKGNPYFKAQLSSKAEQARKAELQKEKERVQQERHEAKERYAARKRVRNKKLCKRNYKGQPILSNQMDLLLEKIVASSSQASGAGCRTTAGLDQS